MQNDFSKYIYLTIIGAQFFCFPKMLVLSTDFQEWFTSEQSLWAVCKEGIKCGDAENALELESSANFIQAVL